MMNQVDTSAFSHDTTALAMQARSLICILEDLMEVDEDRGEHPNAPDSHTQKRWACLGSLRMHVDALADAAGAATAAELAPISAETAPTDRNRGYLTRQAMGNLLMAALEMHTATGRTDAAYVLAEKALTAIGALRTMTNGGRVQP